MAQNYFMQSFSQGVDAGAKMLESRATRRVEEAVRRMAEEYDAGLNHNAEQSAIESAYGSFGQSTGTGLTTGSGSLAAPGVAHPGMDTGTPLATGRGQAAPGRYDPLSSATTGRPTGHEPAPSVMSTSPQQPAGGAIPEEDDLAAAGSFKPESYNAPIVPRDNPTPPVGPAVGGDDNPLWPNSAAPRQPVAGIPDNTDNAGSFKPESYDAPIMPRDAGNTDPTGMDTPLQSTGPDAPATPDRRTPPAPQNPDSFGGQLRQNNQNATDQMLPERDARMNRLMSILQAAEAQGLPAFQGITERAKAMGIPFGAETMAGGDGQDQLTMGDSGQDTLGGNVNVDVDPVQAETVVEAMVSRGVPPHIAQAFTGNFHAESGLNPGINEHDPVVEGSRGGFGLAQWTGPRRRQLEQFAQKRGAPPSDFDTQIDFLMWELENTEAGAYQDILRAPDAETAARLISERFLRPGIPRMDHRIAATRSIASGTRMA